MGGHQTKSSTPQSSFDVCIMHKSTSWIKFEKILKHVQYFSVNFDKCYQIL